jgi:hypothetical protein
MPVTVAAALVIAAAVVVKTEPESVVNPADLVVLPGSRPLSLGGARVMYEVDGQGRAQVSYIAGSGELATETVVLPWSHEVALPGPMRPASVTATVLAGQEVSCLLQVDGRLRDSRASDPGAGVVLCSVVAA